MTQTRTLLLAAVVAAATSVAATLLVERCRRAEPVTPATYALPAASMRMPYAIWFAEPPRKTL